MTAPMIPMQAIVAQNAVAEARKNLDPVLVAKAKELLPTRPAIFVMKYLREQGHAFAPVVAAVERARDELRGITHPNQ